MEAKNRRTRSVHDMEIDEISLVDRPANQHALVTIAKRANEEDAVPEEYFDPQSGEEVDVAQLQDGDVVVDGEGNAFEFTAGDAGDNDQQTEDAEDGEYAEVGKSLRSSAKAFKTGSQLGRQFNKERPGAGPAGAEHWRRYGSTRAAVKGRPGRAGMTAGRYRGVAVGGGSVAAVGAGGAVAHDKLKKSFADEVREELSKAVTDADRDEVLAKALGQLDEYEAGIAEAQEIAKSERDLRLKREYIAKAAEYNVPVDPQDLGPVLMHMAESLPYEDCLVIHKALSAAGEMLFDEAGYTGQADNLDPFEQVEAALDERVAKGEERVSKARAVTEFFDNDPRAYDEYRASLGR